jgi:hypothetical protein
VRQYIPAAAVRQGVPGVGQGPRFVGQVRLGANQEAAGMASGPRASLFAIDQEPLRKRQNSSGVEQGVQHKVIKLNPLKQSQRWITPTLSKVGQTASNIMMQGLSRYSFTKEMPRVEELLSTLAYDAPISGSQNGCRREFTKQMPRLERLLSSLAPVHTGALQTTATDEMAKHRRNKGNPKSVASAAASGAALQATAGRVGGGESSEEDTEDEMELSLTSTETSSSSLLLKYICECGYISRFRQNLVRHCKKSEHYSEYLAKTTKPPLPYFLILPSPQWSRGKQVSSGGTNELSQGGEVFSGKSLAVSGKAMSENGQAVAENRQGASGAVQVQEALSSTGEKSSLGGHASSESRQVMSGVVHAPSGGEHASSGPPLMGQCDIWKKGWSRMEEEEDEDEDEVVILSSTSDGQVTRDIQGRHSPNS